MQPSVEQLLVYDVEIQSLKALMDFQWQFPFLLWVNTFKYFN